MYKNALLTDNVANYVYALLVNTIWPHVITCQKGIIQSALETNKASVSYTIVE